MRAQIQKWGNSFGLRIPMRLIKELKLHEGSPVTIGIQEGHLTIKPPSYNLDEMLKNITPKNQHSQMLDDNAKGEEER